MANAGKPVRTFRREVETSSGTLANLENAMRKTAVAVAAAGAAAATAAVVGFRKLRQEMEAIDKIAKSSAKLGVSTEALVGLQHAADLAGVDIGKLEIAMSRMQRTLSEASLKTGAARDALTQLRIDPKTIAAMSPDEAFLAIADALLLLENQTDRVRLAMEIFGRSGADLLPLLQDGSAAILAAMRDAEVLGLTFSELDARGVERANDAITRLHAATGRLKRALAIELAPILELVANAMTAWLTDSSSGMNTLVDSAVSVVSAIGAIADGVRHVMILWNKFASGALQISYRLTQAMHMFFGKEADPVYLDTLLDEIAKFDSRARELGRADWGRAIADQVAEVRKAAAASLAGDKPAGMFDLEDFEEQQRQMEEQRRQLEELQRRGDALTESLRTPFEIARDRVADANELLAAGVIGWETYGRAIAKAREELERLANQASTAAAVGPGTQEYFEALDRQRARLEMDKQLRELPILPEPPRDISAIGPAQPVPTIEPETLADTGRPIVIEPMIEIDPEPVTAAAAAAPQPSGIDRVGEAARPPAPLKPWQRPLPELPEPVEPVAPQVRAVPEIVEEPVRVVIERAEPPVVAVPEVAAAAERGTPAPPMGPQAAPRRPRDYREPEEREGRRPDRDAMARDVRGDRDSAELIKRVQELAESVRQMRGDTASTATSTREAVLELRTLGSPVVCEM